jgi:hypothetical protein
MDFGLKKLQKCDFEIFVFVFHVKTLGVEPKTRPGLGVVKKKLTKGPPPTAAEAGFIVILSSCIFWLFVQVAAIAHAQVLPFRHHQELKAPGQLQVVGRRRRRKRQSLLPQLAEEGKGGRRRRRRKKQKNEERRGLGSTRSCSVQPACGA